jgi:hypothetical protein
MVMMLPNVAFAGSIGSCGSLNDHAFISGEGPSAIRSAISASMDVGVQANFGPCSPDDGWPKNVSAVMIGISYGGAWLEFGVINCNDTDLNWPTGMCNSTRQLFVEQHGQAFWDYQMWDLGTVDNAAHDYTIKYNTSSHYYDMYYDHNVIKSVNMGTGLVPTQTNSYYWQGETHDVGDGLGTISDAADIGQMSTMTSDGVWHSHAVGSACDTISSEHHCVVNGSYGFYLYTTN